MVDGDDRQQEDELPLGATLTYPDGAAPPPPAEAVLERGNVVGRYVILGKVGEGGMGAVYAAYDPELDRKVALKFLHSNLTGRKDTRSEEARLLREAQAMAKLSHPNVVTVFDVRNHRGVIYLAMEFIEGQTFRQWLDEQPRQWSELWPVLEGAGRGLAAAHDAGIVHRDFKPDNILVDRDGRARVTDFGLARPTTITVSDDELSRSLSPDNKTLTHAGAIMGTPRYMAPEQHSADEVTDRADQFAFAVVVFEALYRERPFKGDTYAELANAVTAGELQQPRQRHGVPAWRHQALLRGLAVSPTERFESLTQLLTGLGTNPHARRNRFVAGVLATAVAVTAGVLLLPRPKHAAAGPTCTASADALEPTWNDAARTRLRDAFATSRLGIAAETANRVTAALDAYAVSWVAMHEEACRATHVQGGQSSEMLDLRMECLDQHHRQMASLIDLLSKKPDAHTVRRSTDAVMSLPSLDRCADRKALRSAMPRPQDPTVAAQVTSIEQRRARAIALYDLGKYKDAHASFSSLLEEARATKHPPLIATILAFKASCEESLGQRSQSFQSMHAAVRAAAEARDDHMVAKRWIQLLAVFPTDKEALAQPYLTMAETALARAGNPPSLVAEYHLMRTTLLTQLGKSADAVAAGARCVELSAKLNPVDKTLLGRAHHLLAKALYSRGDYVNAAKHERTSLALSKEIYGPNHPDVATVIAFLANIQVPRGRYTEAMDLLHQAIAIRRKAFGDDHQVVTELETLLTRILNQAGKFVEADKLVDRLLKREGTSKLNRRLLDDLLVAAVECKRSVNKLADARRLLERSLTLLPKLWGETHPVTGNRYGMLAELCLSEEKWPCVIENATKAQTILGKSLPKSHLAQAYPPYLLGSAYAAQEKHRQAIPWFERSLAITLQSNTAPWRRGLCRLLLARSLLKADPANRKRATALALQARKDYLSIDGPMKKQVKLVDDLLKEYRIKVPKEPPGPSSAAKPTPAPR